MIPQVAWLGSLPSPLFPPLCLPVEGGAEGAAAEKGAEDDHGSSGEEEGASEGGDAEAAGEVSAGEAADSLAGLDQERALLKSVLAELEGADDGDGAAETAGQVGKPAMVH